MRGHGIGQLRQIEGHHPFCAADHLLARHIAAVTFQPVAPVARELIIEVPGPAWAGSASIR
jgi:hypothetical protein